jgi:hypothetical protein
MQYRKAVGRFLSGDDSAVAILGSRQHEMKAYGGVRYSSTHPQLGIGSVWIVRTSKWEDSADSWVVSEQRNNYSD